VGDLRAPLGVRDLGFQRRQFRRQGFGDRMDGLGLLGVTRIREGQRVALKLQEVDLNLRRLRGELERSAFTLRHILRA
jgi:hypothetical protein